MRIELVQGPLDGYIYEVPDNQTIVILAQPSMTPAEFIAAAEQPALLESIEMTSSEHAYVRDRKKLTRAGNHRFIYAGVRQDK
jgi:hypothetical protein